jgi:PAS domain S-box-containing protein
MDEKINTHDLLLEVENLREELHSVTQNRNDLLIYKQQLDAIMDNAPVEVYLKDREGRYTRVNKHYEKVFGVKSEDLVGMLPADALVHDPILAASSRDQDLSVLNSGQAERREEIADLVTEKQPRTLLTIKFPILNAGGEADGLGAIVTDISEDVATKESLRKSNALFSQAEQFGNLGHWEWDEISSRYITCSEQFASIFDMTVAQVLEEITSYEKYQLSICDGDRERCKQEVDAARERKQGWNIKYACYTKAGRQIHLHEIGEPVLDDYGVLIKTIGTVQDITEIRRVEEALQQSNTLFQQAEAIGNMGYWCWSRKGDRLLSCSDQFAQIYDMTVPEALDYFISTEATMDLIHPDDKALFRQATYDSNEQLKELDIEYRVTTLAGNTRHLYLRSEFLLDSDGAPTPHSFGIVQDITEIRQVEKELRQSHSLFQQAEAMGNLGHWCWDRKADKLSSCSYEMAQIYDMTVPEALDFFISSDAVADLLHPDDKKRYRQGSDFYDEVRKGMNTEYCIITRLGNTRHLRVSSEYVLDNVGEPSQLFGIVQDITDERENEAVNEWFQSFSKG